MIRQMLDIECMAQHPNALIICIAMCRFDEETGRIWDCKQLNIDYKDTLKRHPGKFIVDPATVKFWSEQPRATLEDMSKNQITIEETIDTLYKWSVPGQEIWIWGLSFDIPIIESAIRSIKRQDLYNGKFPWKYQNQRDARTLAKTFGFEIERSEGHHNALADVIDQSKCIMKILNAEIETITVDL